MTYLFIEPGLHICGGIRRIVELATRLTNNGHTVYVASPKGQLCTWLPSKFIPIKLSDVVGLCNQINIDICVFNLANQYKLALEVKASVKIFWVLAPEAMYKDPKVPIKALNTDKFYLLSNSKFTVSYIKKYAKNYKKEIPIIPGGINPNHFKFDANIPKNYHVMYYDSDRPWKGSGIITRALSVHPYKILPMNAVKNTPQTTMYTLYNSATCYVSAGQIEGFNFPILEAMYCGCPVVCTSDGGSADFVIPGKNAIVVDRTPKALYEGIARVLKDKPLRRKLSAAGLQTAHDSRYTWENVTKAFINYTSKLIE